MRLGASTTATGQEVLRHQTRKVNELLTGNYEMEGGAIIGGDTDSVSGDTVITVNDSPDFIENIFNDLEIKQKIGDKEYAFPVDNFNVLTYDYKDNKIFAAPAIAIYRHKVSKPQWEIEDENGNIIKITNDHSCMVERDSQLIEVKPFEILDTDLLITLEHTVQLGYDTKIYKIKSIKRIEDFQDEHVYDVIMFDKDRQWFFGNNILVHNSTYFKTFEDNEEDATETGDRIGKEVNDSFPDFMRQNFFCNPEYDTLIETDREVIGSSSIFVKKKNYIIKVVNMEGKKCNKLKAMGISLKKTTLPREFQDKLGTYVERILDKEHWDDIARDIVEYKTELSHIDNILRIGLPKGVKGVDKYTRQYNEEVHYSKIRENVGSTSKEYPLTKEDSKKPIWAHKILEFVNPCKKKLNWKFEKESQSEQDFITWRDHHIDNCPECSKKREIDSNVLWKARLPGHVSASIHWNKCLELYNDKNSIQIISGTKVKTYYLKQKFYNRFTSIAIPTDTTNIPEWLKEHYKEWIDIDAQLYRLIDKSLEAILEAIGKVVPTRQELMVNDLITFDEVTNIEPKIQKPKKVKNEISDEQNDLINDLLSF